MEAKPTAEMALKHKGVIVGIKTAHYMGPDFAAVERAVEAGTLASIPVMVDFGRCLAPEDPRGAPHQEAPSGRHLHPRLFRSAGRAGPGRAMPTRPCSRAASAASSSTSATASASFTWRVAVPIVQEGFLPDSISTDLHAGSSTSEHEGHAERHEQIPGPGLSLEEVILRSTWNPARRSSKSNWDISRSAPRRTWPF